MLRNNLVTLEGRFDFTPEELFTWNMYGLKLYCGQLLLPVKIRYEVGRQFQCQEASFYLVKHYSDGVEDEPTVIPEAAYCWVLNDSLVQEAKTGYQRDWPDVTVLAKYDDDYSSGEDSVFLTAPTSANQHSARITRTVVLYYQTTNVHHDAYYDHEIAREQIDVWFDSEEV